MKTIYLATIALLITTVFSCKKGDSSPANPTSATGLSDSGVVEGYVGVYNQYGVQVYSGLRDIQVSMKGGATVGTDDNGHYIFTKVPTGVYTLTVSGVGLAPTMVSSVSFIRDTLYNNINISQRPTFNVTSIIAYNVPAQYDSVMVTCDGDTRVRNIIVFVGLGSDVSNGNYKLAYVVPVTRSSPITGSPYGSARVPAADLHAAGINAGDTVYYAAYSYVVKDASAYVDPTTGKTVYNAVGQPTTTWTTAP